MTKWKRNMSQGRLVYWSRHLPDQSYLTVNRDGQVWRWRHRGSEFGWLDGAKTRRGYLVQAEGHASSSTIARHQADRYIGPCDQRCPHGCGPLADGGGGDLLICPTCRDEWPNALAIEDKTNRRDTT